MNRLDFDFYLPPHLIAQHPSKMRGSDKLLLLDKMTGALKDALFSALPSLLPQNSLLVFNNSKVRYARVYGKTLDGRDVEFLFTKKVDGGATWEVLSPKMKKLKIGDSFLFGKEIKGILIEKNLLQFEKDIDESFFEKEGHVPLPPYIKREDTLEDKDRYQTIYATKLGSIACPTAGLHFTDEVMAQIREKEIEIAYITLHVGLGTFLPVREERIEEHKMHREEYVISEEVAEKINKAKQQGKKIIACGTTSVRTLEASWNKEKSCIEAGEKATDIFIYPPYKFNVIDGLITNFHTPQSTLLMLVSALCGRENILNAYRHAIEKEYRFFSYGDAMFII